MCCQGVMGGVPLFVLSTLIISCYSADEPLPSYMKPCPQSLPPDEFDICAADMIRSAFPHLVDGDSSKNIPSLDPLHNIKLDLQISNPALQISVTNGTMYGLRNLNVQAARINLNDKFAEFDLQMDRINLLGKYQANGFFIIMPIRDQGPINITQVDLNLSVKINYVKKLKKDKVVHMKLKEVTLTVNSIGRAYYYLGNLFKGAFPLMNDQFNQALNSDWQSVTREALPSVSKAFSHMFKTVVGRILQPYSYNALFPPVQ